MRNDSRSSNSPWNLKILKQSEIDQRSSALSFYTVICLVPILAVLVSLHTVSQGHFFDIQTFLLNYLSPEQGIQFADQLAAIVERSNAQFMGLSGLVFGIFVLYSILSRIDDAIQKIWATDRRSSLAKKTVIFLSQFVIIIPAVFFVVGSALNILPFSSSLAGGSYPFLFSSFAVLFFVYKYFPNRHVRTGPALISAAAISLCFVFGKELVLGLIGKLFNYDEVYGSLASIPLFLTWIYLLWFLFFLGAIGSCYLHEWLEHRKPSEEINSKSLVYHL